MKSSNTVVTIVVVGAVLVAAYAVGLLVRQARTGDSSSSSPSATEANEARIREETAKLTHEPGAQKKKDLEQARAELKEKRAEALAKMESATEEEKARFREQIRERFTAQPDQKAALKPRPRPAPTAAAPAAQDPNASQSPDKAGSEPNRAGES